MDYKTFIRKLINMIDAHKRLIDEGSIHEDTGYLQVEYPRKDSFIIAVKNIDEIFYVDGNVGSIVVYYRGETKSMEGAVSMFYLGNIDGLHFVPNGEPVEEENTKSKNEIQMTM